MATSSAEVLRTVAYISSASTFTEAASITPNSTLVSERFMALHMMLRQNDPGGTDQRTGDDQHVVVDHKTRWRRRPNPNTNSATR